jgi:hypothetical protein
MTRRYEPVHSTIVAIDVAGYGTRSDQVLLRMRAGLRQMVNAALIGQGLGPSDVDMGDRGDWVRSITPAAGSVSRFVGGRVEVAAARVTWSGRH